MPKSAQIFGRYDRRRFTIRFGTILAVAVAGLFWLGFYIAFFGEVPFLPKAELKIRVLPPEDFDIAHTQARPNYAIDPDGDWIELAEHIRDNKTGQSTHFLTIWDLRHEKALVRVEVTPVETGYSGPEFEHRFVARVSDEELFLAIDWYRYNFDLPGGLPRNLIILRFDTRDGRLKERKDFSNFSKAADISPDGTELFGQTTPWFTHSYGYSGQLARLDLISGEKETFPSPLLPLAYESEKAIFLGDRGIGIYALNIERGSIEQVAIPFEPQLGSGLSYETHAKRKEFGGSVLPITTHRFERSGPEYDYGGKLYQDDIRRTTMIYLSLDGSREVQARTLPLVEKEILRSGKFEPDMFGFAFPYARSRHVVVGGVYSNLGFDWPERIRYLATLEAPPRYIRLSGFGKTEWANWWRPNHTIVNDRNMMVSDGYGLWTFAIEDFLEEGSSIQEEGAVHPASARRLSRLNY